MPVMEDLTEIAVGQWVWTMDRPRWSDVERDRVIHEVTRLTKTLIICDEGDEYDRFLIKDGYAHSRYSQRHIVGVASPEEIESVGIPRKAARLAETARRAKCDEVRAILPRGMTSWLNFEGEWKTTVELNELSEDQVRKLAAAVDEILGGSNDPS